MWLSFNTDMRYLMPFYGVALIQLSILLRNYYDMPKSPLDTYFGPKGRVALFSFVLVIVLCLQFIYSKKILPDRISPDMNAVSFLKNYEGADKNTRIFTDADHVIGWKTGWMVFDPTIPKFSLDFLEARSEQDFYTLMEKYDIKYVVNHPWSSPWEEDTFSVIERNHERFRQILDERGLKIWKVLY